MWRNDDDEDTGVVEQDNQDDHVYGPDEWHGAQLYLPHDDRTEIAKVIGRKRNLDGNFIGRKNSNPILD